MKIEDFPEGTEFYIKEFDIPLAHIPNKGWINFFGGRARPYDAYNLKPENNWPAENFQQWQQVVEDSE